MSVFAFLIAAVILAITPGPGIAYVVARTVAGGRPEGLASCLGTGRFLQSDAARAARARIPTRASGVTMLGLGAYLALARRDG
jgi:threonine/homoserine/homoserine lactone efflux protein